MDPERSSWKLPLVQDNIRTHNKTIKTKIVSSLQFQHKTDLKNCNSPKDLTPLPVSHKKQKQKTKRKQEQKEINPST